MTISYTAEVATCTGFGCFLKLLRRWRGSIYKLVWPDLTLFLILYYTCAFFYRMVLNDEHKIVFEALVDYCNNDVSSIPISFVLGFYIALVVKRWWDQYNSVPWPDPLAVFVSSLLHGQDEEGRVMRRTIMRYASLSLTIVLSNVSPRVKKRFPTYDHLVDAGLMTENEKDVIEQFIKDFPKHPKYWMPIIWAGSIVTRARKEGRIRDDFSLKTLIDELNKFRGNCAMLLHYDFISLPLVYTQVVTLAVYSYFFFNIMGKQWTEGEDKHGYENTVDYYFPLFVTLEFFFYVGWLKVAETLINPFGDDDDDFELNWMIDRNFQVSYLIVDEMHHEHPELIKDQYWDQTLPATLPYANTDAAEFKREEPPEPSTAKFDQNVASARPSDSISDTASISNNINLRSSLSYLTASVRRLLSSTNSRRIEAKKRLLQPSISEDSFSIHSDVVTPRPTLGEDIFDSSISSINVDTEVSDFEKLRREREKERTERQRQNLQRTTTAVPTAAEEEANVGARQSRSDEEVKDQTNNKPAKEHGE